MYRGDRISVLGFVEAGRLKEAVTTIDAIKRHTLVGIHFGLVLCLRGAQLVLVKSFQWLITPMTPRELTYQHSHPSSATQQQHMAARQAVKQPPPPRLPPLC